MKATILKRGALSFTIEGRILRELGERLVKRPEVAIVELIKNAYDADATECTVDLKTTTSIAVTDNGSGMTMATFSSGWMRIGTSAKESVALSEKLARRITGEKGIGRFAVRFLGRKLRLTTVADDPDRVSRTRLIADFNWPDFDRNEDLGVVQVPYSLEQADEKTPTGTELVVSDLRPPARALNMDLVRTSSIAIISPLGSLLRQVIGDHGGTERDKRDKNDPGFVLRIIENGGDESPDVGAALLEHFTVRARLKVAEGRLRLEVGHRDVSKAVLRIVDAYPSTLSSVVADIRFFPRRSGAFANVPIDGRRAYTWVAKNSGVAVFDRGFRVSPYGLDTDDWLRLDEDAARNRRDPRSTIASKYFPMAAAQRGSTAENWMLRLPQSAQLIGLVSVEGERTGDPGAGKREGLIAAADREGFVHNRAFQELYDLVRGSVEAIAYTDRRVQRAVEEQRRKAVLETIKKDAQAAIAEVGENPHIRKEDKDRIIAFLSASQVASEQHEQLTRKRRRELEVMSLVGVVAGFMTHEFGGALRELQNARKAILACAAENEACESVATRVGQHIKRLEDISAYAAAYVQGVRIQPEQPYLAAPRVRQVKRIFGRYAEDRNICVETNVDVALMAPLVPVALYNGIILNLYTNALKAVTAKVGVGRETIAIRAWNERSWHYVEVVDTGIGIPARFRDRVFDPLFTTTESRRDPLGSGMGLGLTLVRRSVETFGGRAEVVDPPPGFTTCVRIKLPIKGGGQ